MQDIYSEVEIRKLPAMRVASFIVISGYPEIQAFDYLRKWVQKQSTPPLSNRRSFGFDYPVSEDQKKAGLRGYEAWITIPDGWTESDEVSIKKIPEQDFAVLRVSEPFVDPFRSIPGGWRKLRDLVKKNKYTTDWSRPRHCLEEVTEKNGKTWMDLYFPIDM
ncbi:GyrI-like domain-containing protein [bacterium]|nr:GyrI-like domain-containing protein [bacterium]